MHGLLPHAHHEQLSVVEHEIEHNTADNIFDYLKLIFHIDLGDGHLEYFETGESLDFDLVPTIIIVPHVGVNYKDIILQEDQLLEHKRNFNLEDDPFPDVPITSANLRRGPPTIS